MDIFKILLSLALVGVCLLYSWRRRGGRESPPGPPPLPIVGNIFQLGMNPHISLAKLAKKYGPLMSLKLGTQSAVIISSPEMAMEVLQKHGSAFSNRSNPVALSVHGHDEVSMPMVPATTAQWKKLRKIAKEQLFSNPALQASQAIRLERMRKLADHVSKCSGEGRAMNVGEATFTTMSNLMFSTLFSIEYFQFGAVDNKLKEHINYINRYMGVPNISDFIPIFAPLDPQGIKRKMEFHFGSVLEIVLSIIKQRIKDREASDYKKKNDFLETLLDLSEGKEYDLTVDEIKHFTADLLISGSDTSAATTEWTMLELFLNPDKLGKVKAELDSVIGEKRIIEESDISKLPYLQATIKESLRYHPVAPLLNPREAVEDTRVKGYLIPKNAKIITNFWAITRNPSIWKDPESFEPERFLGNNIDFQGQNFDLIPFGSGRRICPGMNLAGRMLHCMVATFCHNFDWELEGATEVPKHVHREGLFGLALQKKEPLRAVPIKL